MVAVARYLYTHHGTGLEHCCTRVHHQWLVIDKYFYLFWWLLASSCSAVYAELGSSCVCVCVCVCVNQVNRYHKVLQDRRIMLTSFLLSAKSVTKLIIIYSPEALARWLTLPAKCLSILETRTLAAFSSSRGLQDHMITCTTHAMSCDQAWAGLR